MKILIYPLITAAIITLFLLLVTYICFLLVFCTAKRKPEYLEAYRIPPGKIYEPFHDRMISWMKEARNLSNRSIEEL